MIILKWMFQTPASKVFIAVGIFTALLLAAVACAGPAIGPIPTVVPEQPVKMKYIGEKGLVEFWQISGNSLVCIAAIRPDSVDLECR